MKRTIAILDANVLFSAPVRDLLLQLAYDGVYEARWSEYIDHEWRRALIARRPDLASRLGVTLARMHRALPDALVEGYASLIDDLVLPDPGDRHVLAAAITADADAIVTYNLKDFPTSVLAPYGIEAWHPDTFIGFLTATNPLAVLSAMRACLARLIHPPLSAATYVKNLRDVGLVDTAAFLDGKLP